MILTPPSPLVPLIARTSACKKMPPTSSPESPPPPPPPPLTETPPPAVQIVARRLPVTPPATPPTIGTAPTPQFSQAFHNYLVNRVAIQTAELNLLGTTNKGLTNDNNFLKGTNKEISALNADIERQLRASKKQVDRLKGLLTRKKTQFELLLMGEQVQNASLLEEMIAEKAQVASLQKDLQALNLARIPAPESLDDIALTIKQIVNCTAKKGTHLSTKVRIICECVLSQCFDGACRTYLMDRTRRHIQSENPYRHAI
jgi:hypothetical protein